MFVSPHLHSFKYREVLRHGRSPEKNHNFALAAAIVLTCVLVPIGYYIAWSAVMQSIDPPQRPAILLIGDSLTEQGGNPSKDGWVSLLQFRYTRSADIIVRGLSGYNTRWFLKYAMPIIEGEVQKGIYSPSLVSVWLGANDAALANGSNWEQHVPLANYTANLVNIVKLLKKAAPGAKVLLVTPPHVNDIVSSRIAAERNDAKRGLLDRSNEMTGYYARACVETAGKAGVAVLDLHTYFNAMAESTRNALLEDGLHFNAAGNYIVDEQIRTKIEVDFPDLFAKLQSWQLPGHAKWVKEDPWDRDQYDRFDS